MRYKIHAKSFRQRGCMNETESSKQGNRNHGLDNNLLWEIYKKTSPFQCCSKRCNLCLSGKVSIICADPDTLLN